MALTEALHVTVVRLTVRIPASRSLKDKRAVVRSVKDGVQARHHLRVIECGAVEDWQRADLGFAVTGSESGRVEATVRAVIGEVAREAELAVVATDVRVYPGTGEEAEPWTKLEQFSPRDADVWVPPAWQADVERP